jgi:5-bromo-4-chloroindolyl phosphate hydrolysis protein
MAINKTISMLLIKIDSVVLTKVVSVVNFITAYVMLDKVCKSDIKNTTTIGTTTILLITVSSAFHAVPC